MIVTSKEVISKIYSVEMTEEEYKNILGELRYIRDTNPNIRNTCSNLCDFTQKLAALSFINP
jgi:hypothetical protein